MRWIWRGFCAELPVEGAQGIHVDRREGREVAVRWTLCTPETVDEVLPAADRAPRAPEPEEASPPTSSPCSSSACCRAPRALPVSRLSYSGLEAYRKLRLPLLPRSGRCGLGQSSRAGGARRRARSRRRAREGGISALLRGTVVHGLLERLDFGEPVVPSRVGRGRGHRAARHRGAARERRGRSRHGRAARGSALRERIAGARRVRTELPFAFTLDVGNRSLLFNGVVDVHADEGARTLVVDWKSDALGELEPEASRRSPTRPSESSTPSPPSGPVRSAWRSSTATWSAPTSPPSRNTRPRDWSSWSAAARARSRRGRGPFRAVRRAAFRAMCGLSRPGRAVCARFRPHNARRWPSRGRGPRRRFELFRPDPVLMWRPCHCVSSSPRKRSAS